MKIGIVIATYFRNDGRSKFFLSRCLKSISEQTHKEYKVFLIGDKYENSTEFQDISGSLIDGEKIYAENLTYAKERDVYHSDPDKLWCAGGVNAINYGIEKAISEGYDYICHLDHDDYWHPIHLEAISHFLDRNQNYIFVATYCNYLNKYNVPLRSAPGDYYPQDGDITHSATCVKFSDIDLRYRDVFSETGEPFPADADLWIRLRKHMQSNDLKGSLLGVITTYLDKPERG